MINETWIEQYNSRVRSHNLRRPTWQWNSSQNIPSATNQVHSGPKQTLRFLMQWQNQNLITFKICKTAIYRQNTKLKYELHTFKDHVSSHEPVLFRGKFNLFFCYHFYRFYLWVSLTWQTVSMTCLTSSKRLIREHRFTIVVLGQWFSIITINSLRHYWQSVSQPGCSHWYDLTPKNALLSRLMSIKTINSQKN